MFEKVKTALKWIGAGLLTILGILIGKKMYNIFKKPDPVIEGSISNPNKKKDEKEADQIRKDIDSLKQDI